METKLIVTQEKEPPFRAGMPMLILYIVLMLMGLAVAIIGGLFMDYSLTGGVVLLVLGTVYLCVGWIPFLGLKVLKPQEALVLTLFGKYYGTLRGEGFFYVNPFVSAVNPSVDREMTSAKDDTTSMKLHIGGAQGSALNLGLVNRKLSLKVMTLNNNKQKVNDQLGNPVEIGIVVIWRVVNTAKAVFCVDNYKEFLSIQCDAALRNIVRMYPYDVADDGASDERSLRGSSQEVADKLKSEIQDKVEKAGLEIIEARITYLAYAPEIAAAMLQRQQATAIVDARKTIVDGAVGMVEMALERLGEHGVVQLDEERKAAMVSNLLVVLCGNKDAQPVVNSGSLY